MNRHFYKTYRNKMIAGVCSGISEEFNVDVSIIRVVWALTAFGWGSGIVLYILCAIIFPTE